MKQKTIPIIFAAFLFFGIGISSASAATYFMRADGTAPNKTAAIGPATDSSKCMNVTTHKYQTFSPGDTIVLSSLGGPFAEEIRIPSSGAPGNPITYDGDYENTGTFAEVGARADIAGWNASGSWTDLGNNRWSIALVTNPRRMWIDGTERLLFKSSSVTPNEPWHWASDVLYVSSTGNPANTFSSMQFPGPGTINCFEKDYITFKRITVKNNYTAFRLRSTHGCIVENCNIGEGACGGGIYVSVDYDRGYYSTTRGIIRNCVFDSKYNNYNNTWKNNGFQAGDGLGLGNGTEAWEVYDNKFYDWSHCGIYLWASRYPAVGNKIYRNFVTAQNLMYGHGICADTTAAGAGEGNEIYQNFIYKIATVEQLNCKDLKYHHNIIYGIHSPLPSSVYGLTGRSGLALGGYSATLPQDMEIYNNVIVGADNYGLTLDQAGYNQSPITGNKITNNIIIDNGQSNTDYQIYVANDSDINTNTFENNLVYKSEKTDIISYRGSSMNIDNFNSHSGNNNDAMSANIFGDPLFLNTSGNFSSTYDFKLQSSSPAIDSGADVAFTSDFEGTLIPQGAAPDIGAFEYSSGTPQYRPADINQDNSVNVIDLGILMSDFGKSAASSLNPRSDINSDGFVNVVDLGIMMSEWS